MIEVTGRWNSCSEWDADEIGKMNGSGDAVGITVVSKGIVAVMGRGIAIAGTGLHAVDLVVRQL